MTASLGNGNIDKERGGKYGIEIITLLLILFNVEILLLLLFATAVRKLLLLTQGIVHLFESGRVVWK